MQSDNRSKNITRRNSSDTGGTGMIRAGLAAAGCGLVLLCGFFFAGSQHFMSMDYGIRNSKLRKELDDLKAEKQRLLYTKEVALSPDEIKKAATRAGIPNRRDTLMPKLEMVSAAKPGKADVPQGSAPKPTVIKTASVSASAPRIERTIDVTSTHNSKKRSEKK